MNVLLFPGQEMSLLPAECDGLQCPKGDRKVLAPMEHKVQAKIRRQNSGRSVSKREKIECCVKRKGRAS